MACSLAVIHALSSITKRIKSASSTIFLMNFRSSWNSCNPGLSRKMTSPTSSNLVWWCKISLVVQWISVTIALNCQISLLNSVDFHTFVAQTNQIFMGNKFIKSRKCFNENLVNYKKRDKKIYLKFIMLLVIMLFQKKQKKIKKNK